MVLPMECPVTEQAWRRRLGMLVGVPAREVLTPDTAVGAGPWEPAVREIVEFQDLGDNWDGYGAEAPRREVLESAIGLAYCFLESGVPPPFRVAPGVAGEVIFEWQDADGTCTEVEIDRPLHAEVMVVGPGKRPCFATLPMRE
jgi:hypothetical protein